MFVTRMGVMVARHAAARGRPNTLLGQGGETGPVNDLVRSTVERMNLGVVDEMEIALAPVLFGSGRRLFENLREPGPQFRIDRVFEDSAATHLRYVRQ